MKMSVVRGRDLGEWLAWRQRWAWKPQSLSDLFMLSTGRLDPTGTTSERGFYRWIVWGGESRSSPEEYV